MSTGISIGAWEAFFWFAAAHGSIFAYRLFAHDMPDMTNQETMDGLMNLTMAFRTVTLEDHPNFVFYRWILAAVTTPIIASKVLDRIFKTKEE